MIETLREGGRAFLACLIMFVICSAGYPAVVWGLAQLLFPHRAEGSLIHDRERRVIGSELIAQPFTSDRYFHPRPSAVNYAADAAGGSNLGATNPALRDAIIERARALGATSDRPAPLDLVTASGGGLDPHISPEAAVYQAARVAESRKRPMPEVLSLIETHIERDGALIGAPPRVNVLKLNLALDVPSASR